MRGRVEAADAFQFVAEKIEARGRGGVEGVDVEQAAAHGVLAGGFADGLGVVAEFVAEFLREFAEIDARAGGEADFPRGQIAGARRGLQQRRERGDDDEPPARAGDGEVFFAVRGERGEDGQPVALALESSRDAGGLRALAGQFGVEQNFREWVAAGGQLLEERNVLGQRVELAGQAGEDERDGRGVPARGLLEECARGRVGHAHKQARRKLLRQKNGLHRRRPENPANRPP